MNLLRHLLLTTVTLLPGGAAMAQRVMPSSELRDFSEQRIHHQKTLGLALGSFAIANIAVGAVAAGQTAGETKYFHRMNVYWNVVNLGIAGVGLLGSRKRKVAPESLADAVRQHENMKQLLLINAVWTWPTSWAGRIYGSEPIHTLTTPINYGVMATLLWRRVGFYWPSIWLTTLFSKSGATDRSAYYFLLHPMDWAWYGRFVEIDELISIPSRWFWNNLSNDASPFTTLRIIYYQSY